MSTEFGSRNAPPLKPDRWSTDGNGTESDDDQETDPETEPTDDEETERDPLDEGLPAYAS